MCCRHFSLSADSQLRQINFVCFFFAHILISITLTLVGVNIIQYFIRNSRHRRTFQIDFVICFFIIFHSFRFHIRLIVDDTVHNTCSREYTPISFGDRLSVRSCVKERGAHSNQLLLKFLSAVIPIGRLQTLDHLFVYLKLNLYLNNLTRSTLIELVGRWRSISTNETNQRMRRTFGTENYFFFYLRRCCCGRCLAYPESAQ